MTVTQWLALGLKVSIMLTVLALGLTATLQDATYLLRQPKLLARAFLSMNVIMPIVAAFVATTFALPFEVKAALVALAASPVPPILYKKQLTAGGRKEYVVGLMVAMSLLAIVVVPLTIALIAFEPTWQELQRLAVIAVIRTFLSFFLDREVADTRTVQRSSQIPEKAT
jgi:bile acid:Na+ symporter, BASS family